VSIEFIKKLHRQPQKNAAAFFAWALPKHLRQTVVVVSDGQNAYFQTFYLQKWPKNTFEIVVMVEGASQSLIAVHRKFTNTHPVFCRKNVRCKVKGG